MFLLLCSCLAVSLTSGLESIDLLAPIVRLSPALGDDDMFGFSFAVHRFFDDPTKLTATEILEQTVILVGAPKGQFPGGLNSITPNGLACRESYFNSTTNEIFTDDDFLRALDPDEVWPCYEGRQWGLVYQCSLHVDECIAPLGNGDREGFDGLLFDSVGNTIFNGEYDTQYKDNQFMGYNMYSNGDYFVVCAPLWEYSIFNGYDDSVQGRGRCIYSDRSLTNFNPIYPCHNTNRGTSATYCVTGLGVHLSNSGNDTWLSAGVPNYRSGIHYGGIYYHDQLNSPVVLSDNGVEYVEFFQGPTSDNIFDEEASYFGFTITSGDISLDGGNEDIITGAPRYSSASQTGRISVITDPSILPALSIDGDYFGEYFGHSVAAVDLNGDGYDDLVVGAPMYSDTATVDTGRIIALYNINGTDFIKSVVIVGQVSYGRFGYSIAGLGDLNNDGYEDFAVSAPYEGSGVVYIYHGQAADDSGSIVNTDYQQRIVGDDVILETELIDVATFGFTLSGNVDIDLNEYNDLVVGAFESQAVFILKARPVANVALMVSSMVDEVVLMTFSCSDTAGRPVTCFTINVCASYTGRGLENGFTSDYRVTEDVFERQRLFFINNGTEGSSVTGTFTFTGENEELCNNVTIYVLNFTSASVSINDLLVRIEMLQIYSSQQNTDLSLAPVIDSVPQVVAVPVAAECGEDTICNSDLFIRLVNLTFLTNGNVHSRQDKLTVGVVTSIVVDLEYGNIGEDAFSPFITFFLPSSIQHFSKQPTEPPCDGNVSDDGVLYTCNIGFALNRAQGTQHTTLTWRPSSSLIGNEDDISINFLIAIPEQMRNMESALLLGDNNATVSVSFTAAAIYDVGIQFSQDVIQYDSTTSSSVSNLASSLGRQLDIQVTFRNEGPSKIFNASLSIYIPVSSVATGNFYYYYPASLGIVTAPPVTVINCNDAAVLNPDGFIVAGPNVRRKRWAPSLERIARQNEQILPTTLDCASNPKNCLVLYCDIRNLVLGSIVLNIQGYLDDRFYEGKSEGYVLRAHARAAVHDSFISTDGSTTMSTDDVTLTFSLFPQDTNNILLYIYIIVPIVVAVSIIFMVALTVALYCFGFFRRKRLPTQDDLDEASPDPEEKKAKEAEAEAMEEKDAVWDEDTEITVTEL